MSWLREHGKAVAGGAFVGVLMGVLVWQGNPGNMGLCGVCFVRDIAGGIGLHRAAPVQYIRPEVIGIILGALAAALFAKEFRARGGAAPLMKFLLGAWVSIGALVFLGCPFRMLQRLGGGDVNAVFGLLGLLAGIWAGVLMVRRGYSAGRAQPRPPAAGLLMSLLAVALLAALLLRPAGIFFSEKGPGAMHAAWWLSLAAGIAGGAALQRTRFCTLGAFRDALFFRERNLLYAALAIIVAYGGTSAAFGNFRAGMEGQPAAHTDILWNTASMVLVGLAASMAGGCPVRQFVLAGEGDTDAGVTFLGMLVGAAMAHNLGMASTPRGPSTAGGIAVVAGLVFCLALGLALRERKGGTGDA